MIPKKGLCPPDLHCKLNVMKVFWVLYLIIIAYFTVLLFIYLFKTRGPWGNSWTFFLIILFSLLFADIWIKPFGPFWRDVYWLPPIAGGLLTATVLALLTRQLSKSKIRNRKTSTVIYFWLVFSILVILILVGLLINR